MSEEKKSMDIKGIADTLRAWTKSDGKKPRQWAKIPVGTLNALCSALEEAQSEELRTACERARGWQEDAMRVRKLLGRLAPYMEETVGVLRRTVELAKKGGARVVDAVALVTAENKLQVFSTLVGEAKAEAGRGEE